MPMALLLVTRLTGRAALPSPREAFPLKGKTQRLFLNPTESKTNPLVGKKRRNRVCNFCRQLSQTVQSCTSVLPAATARSFLPFPNLSWKMLSLCYSEIVGTGRSLRTALDFRSFSFTCLRHKVDTKRKSLSHLAVLLLHGAMAGAT